MRRGAGVLAKGLAISLAAGTAMPAAEAAEPAAAPAAAPAPTLYSPDSDPFFAQPYIDIDEWRDAPVRHRYVHGGFKGTDT